jgi:hypothetical protein
MSRRCAPLFSYLSLSKSNLSASTFCSLETLHPYFGVIFATADESATARSGKGEAASCSRRLFTAPGFSQTLKAAGTVWDRHVDRWHPAIHCLTLNNHLLKAPADSSILRRFRSSATATSVWENRAYLGRQTNVAQFASSPPQLTSLILHAVSTDGSVAGFLGRPFPPQQLHARQVGSWAACQWQKLQAGSWADYPSAQYSCWDHRCAGNCPSMSMPQRCARSLCRMWAPVA